MNFAVKPLAAAVIFGILAVASAPAHAETDWQKHHPRRAEVNHRLAHQQHRITHERQEGKLTAAQAHSLRHQDHAIRAEERNMAAQHGGHITKADKRALNQQENYTNREIGH